MLFRYIKLLIELFAIGLLILIAQKLEILPYIDLSNCFNYMQIFLTNTYVSSVLCSIIAVLIVFFFQVKYSKMKLRKDFRCNEIMEEFYHIFDNDDLLETLSQKVTYKATYQEEDCLIHYNIYKDNKSNIDILAFFLLSEHNSILLESVQACFFLNLNFKVLGIVNNIKNRLLSLRKHHEKVEEIYKKYEIEKNNDCLIDLCRETNSYFLHLKFMKQYWIELFDYIGYDYAVTRKFLDLYKTEYTPRAEMNQPFKYYQKDINRAMRKAKLLVYKEKFESFIRKK